MFPKGFLASLMKDRITSLTARVYGLASTACTPETAEEAKEIDADTERVQLAALAAAAVEIDVERRLATELADRLVGLTKGSEGTGGVRRKELTLEASELEAVAADCHRLRQQVDALRHSQRELLCSLLETSSPEIPETGEVSDTQDRQVGRDPEATRKTGVQCVGTMTEEIPSCRPPVAPLPPPLPRGLPEALEANTAISRLVAHLRGKVQEVKEHSLAPPVPSPATLDRATSPEAVTLLPSSSLPLLSAPRPSRCDVSLESRPLVCDASVQACAPSAPSLPARCSTEVQTHHPVALSEGVQTAPPLLPSCAIKVVVAALLHLALTHKRLRLLAVRMGQKLMRMAAMLNASRATLRDVEQSDNGKAYAALQGELCVMHAKCTKLKEQLAAAKAAAVPKGASREVAVVAAGVPKEDRALVPIETNRLVANMKQLEAENAHLVQRIGVVKNRAVTLSRYEVKCGALEKELTATRERLEAVEQENASMAVFLDKYRSLDPAEAVAKMRELEDRLVEAGAKDERIAELEARCAVLEGDVQRLQVVEATNAALELGLQGFDDLRKLHAATAKELEEAHQDRSAYFVLKSKLEDLQRDHAEATARIEELLEWKQRAKVAEREAARLPALHKEIDRLRFDLERAVWNAKVERIGREEDLEKMTASHEEMAAEIHELKMRIVDCETERQQEEAEWRRRMEALEEATRDPAPLEICG